MQLLPKDRLIFTGIVDSIVDLQQVKGISPATDQQFKLDTEPRERLLVEAVVSPTHPVNGRTIREGQFRNLYDAVVLAVARNGEHIKEKTVDIELRTGDQLTLVTKYTYLTKYNNSIDYFLISVNSNYNPPDYFKSWIGWSIMAAMVSTVAIGLLSIFQASYLAAVI